MASQVHPLSLISPTSPVPDCQICLELIKLPWTLECAHSFCRGWIQKFWKSQKERNVEPACPLWVRKISQEWLEGIENAHKVEIAPNTYGSIEVFHLPEDQTRRVLCPTCLENFGVNHLGTMNAACAWGSVFWVEWNHPWEGEDHVCRSRINLFFQRQSPCRKCGHRIRFDIRDKTVDWGNWETRFWTVWREVYDVGHCFSPLNACGRWYRTQDPTWQNILLTCTIYMLIDVFVYPQLLFWIWAFPNEKKPSDSNQWVWLILSIVFWVIPMMSLLGVFISFLMLAFTPLFAFFRWAKLVNRKRGNREG